MNQTNQKLGESQHYALSLEAKYFLKSEEKDKLQDCT